MTHRTTTLLVGAAAAMLLPACGAAPTSGSTPPEPTTSPPTAAESAPPPRSTEPQRAESSGEYDLVLTDVRVGQQEGADRIVLDFSGTGAPGWSVEYVDEAVIEGSGKVVDLAGDAVLQISASGTTYPGPDQDSYRGPRRIPVEGLRVAEVYVVGTFEGYTQVFVGIDGGPAPFTTFALAGPSRLVVDVEDGR